ncbi:MAG: hypothetical protein LBR41_00635, partial [Rickettsiales bacterium]|nr:hypothetical protein [Rickettsiales bacterium]
MNFWKKILLICVAMPITVAVGDDLQTSATLQEAEQIYLSATDVCGGISDQISQVSGISKINTAVSGVGAVAAGGALYAGIKKSAEDERIEELERQICESGGCDSNSLEQMSDMDYLTSVLNPMSEIAELQERIQKSKQQGNWRTGLLFGSGAANIASAILAGTNKDQSDLIQHTIACNNAISELTRIRGVMMASGLLSADNPIAEPISNAVLNCRTINISDLEKIERRMKTVMGTSIAGAATGTAGGIVSATANSDSVRNNNTDAGQQKEKNLNIT